MIYLEVLIEFSCCRESQDENFFPKVEESIKALYVSMDEIKKRTAMLRAKREFFRKGVF